MTDSHTHLTEEERHGLADGTLSPEQLPRARSHVDGCSSCAADVARLAALVTRARMEPAPPMGGDDLWPSIRARIEHTKMVSLPGTGDPRPGARAGSRVAWIVGTAAAALLIALVAVRGRGREASGGSGDAAIPATDSNVSLVAVLDSTHAYEEEARTLLDKLELQRAMLRPETRAALDRDLHVVDVAITELKDAIARDPNNPALRQLLASSYRQKVDLLKRVGNAS